MSSVYIFKYADDTVFVGNIATPEDFSIYVQEVTRVLCKAMDLILNVSKPQEMIFTTQRKALHVQPISINNQQVPIKEAVRYLGVTLDYS